MVGSVLSRRRAVDGKHHPLAHAFGAWVTTRCVDRLGLWYSLPMVLGCTRLDISQNALCVGNTHAHFAVDTVVATILQSLALGVGFEFRIHSRGAVVGVLGMDRAIPHPKTREYTCTVRLSHLSWMESTDHLHTLGGVCIV